MRRMAYSILVALAVLSHGCAGTLAFDEQLKQSAVSYAKSTGFDLTKYHMRSVYLKDPMEKMVLFESNEPTTGDHFIVAIDRRSGEKRIIYGR